MYKFLLETALELDQRQPGSIDLDELAAVANVDEDDVRRYFPSTNVLRTAVAQARKAETELSA